jgi:iron complex outermembrane receptor protein
VSAYVSRVDDFILIQSNVSKPSGMGTRSSTIARNIDARTWGGEAGIQYGWTPAWSSLASVAYVHGQNKTDGHALGQISPLESRFGLDWKQGPWSAGGLLRWVAGQHRYAINEGNIVGQDLGVAKGFAITSLHAAYRGQDMWTFSAGIDNLFDQAYAESISRAGAAVMGYDQTVRVNEPGRVWWFKAQLTLN